MERIEIPAEVYFKSKDGKKFRVQEDCERWEAAYSKWTNQAVYREFENEEGQLCYAFWLESEEDLEDVLWFFDTKMHSCTRGSGFVKDLYPQWVVAYPYYDGYNSDYSVSSIVHHFGYAQCPHQFRHGSCGCYRQVSEDKDWCGREDCNF